MLLSPYPVEPRSKDSKVHPLRLTSKANGSDGSNRWVGDATLESLEHGLTARGLEYPAATGYRTVDATPIEDCIRAIVSKAMKEYTGANHTAIQIE